MVAEVNKLADLVELGSLPAWVKEQIDSKREEIIENLQSGKAVTLEGPAGERIEIKPKLKVAAAR